MVRSDAGVDWRLVQLASDPEGLMTLELLAERTASPREVATRLGLAETVVRWRVEQLRKMGLIELAGERREEGELEHCYRAVASPIWSNEETTELNLRERLHLATWIVQLIGRDAEEARKAGTLNARPDTHASRTRFVVDAQGWRELNRIQDEALDASFAVQAASAERLAESGEEGIHVMGAMLSVEMPPPSRPA
jgi:DNA-binding transcriptional ArsR family regulator